MKTKEPIPPKILQVIMNVAEIFEVPVEAILHKNRKRENVEARHVAMYYLWTNTEGKRKFSQGTLGGWFNRDHTSVIHALQNVKNWLDIYPDFAEKYATLQRACAHISFTRTPMTLAERIERLPKIEKEAIITYIEKLEKHGNA